MREMGGMRNAVAQLYMGVNGSIKEKCQSDTRTSSPENCREELKVGRWEGAGWASKDIWKGPSYKQFPLEKST